MKKALSLILALMLCLTLCACGGEKNENTDTKNSESLAPEDAILNVSDIAKGKICNVTVTAAEYVDVIEDGYKEDLWGYGGEIKYQDVVANEGYSILKISYKLDYTGKEKGLSTIDFEIDYDDGYIFSGHDGHGSPTIGGLTSGFTKSYTFRSNITIDVDDPLTFQNTSGCVYIFVNEEVKNNTAKPCVLRITMPTSLTSDSEEETFTYNLR